MVLILYKELKNPGDRLVGERIYAQFRDWMPKKGPNVSKNNNGIERKICTLKKTVVCVIENPIRKK